MSSSFFIFLSRVCRNRTYLMSSVQVRRPALSPTPDIINFNKSMNSYNIYNIRIIFINVKYYFYFFSVEWVGIEPTTPCLQNRVAALVSPLVYIIKRKGWVFRGFWLNAISEPFLLQTLFRKLIHSTFQLQLNYLSFICTPDRARICNLLLRRQLHYPIMLRTCVHF
jgi:hypothetical protein